MHVRTSAKAIIPINLTMMFTLFVWLFALYVFIITGIIKGVIPFCSIQVQSL